MLYSLGIILYMLFWHLPWGTKVLSIGVDYLLSERRVKGFIYLGSVIILPLILICVLL